ncbi:MAG: CatA-like O-acetyltransferase [Gammaproteobacteria bacterium]
MEMNDCKLIDLDTYERAKTFEAFKNHDVPVLSTACNVDITNARILSERTKISTFIIISYYVSKVLNEVPNFRHRIVDDRLYEYYKINPGYTVLLENKTFTFCDSEYEDDLVKFSVLTKERMDRVKKEPDLGMGEKHNMFFISNIPWFSFSSFVHPYIKKYASIPLVTIGKYFSSAERTLAPVAIQANHALVDGFHIGQFFDGLSEYTNGEQT